MVLLGIYVSRGGASRGPGRRREAGSKVCVGNDICLLVVLVILGHLVLCGCLALSCRLPCDDSAVVQQVSHSLASEI